MAKRKSTKRRKPPQDSGPITDVNNLPVVKPAVAAKIKAACGLGSAAKKKKPPVSAAAVTPPPDKPGTERWFVKTGQDPDRIKVGKNVILTTGQNLKPGIVDATLEELVSIPRPPGLTDPTQDPPQFSKARDGQTEVTIWRVTANIIAIKHESDGDYHLVLQGTSGAEMIAEIPTPTTVFVGDSPWIVNMGQARQQIDSKFVVQLKPADFVIAAPELVSLKGRLVPHGTMTVEPRKTAGPEISFVTPPPGSSAIQPAFQTAVTPTMARLTGVGFFDRAHGATGAAPNVIELHPVLKVEFL